MAKMRRCPSCEKRLASDAPEGLCFQCREKEKEGDALTAPRRTRLSRVGEYEILEEIARGSMGIVYKARQLRVNRLVALKMILGGQWASEEDVRRFQSESEAVAQLQHPNIVCLHEAGELEGQPFFSMAYVEGQSLAIQIFHHVLPAEQAARYLRKVAEAVHYAHQRGMIHRDLKPGNILIDARDQPQITDFGLAKMLESGHDPNETGMALGTPSYMSPEQARGLNDQLTPQSDIYSLGAILYHCLTGRPPFLAANKLDTLWQVQHIEPAPPRTMNPNIPRPLETICLKCLEKDPRFRYATAHELAEDLHRFLHRESILARRRPQRQLVTWTQLHPFRAVLAAALLIAVLASIAANLAGWP